MGIGLIIAIVVVGVLAVGGLFVSLVLIRKVEPGSIGVRVGMFDYVISDTWVVGIPFVTQYNKMDISVKKLEIERKGQDGLICEDNIRADIVVAFYIKVNYPKVDYQGYDPASPEGEQLFAAAMKSKDRFEDVRKVAQTVGCDRASDVDLLKELFEAKFSEALKTAGKLMEFQNLYTERTKFRDEIKRVIGHDLNGYALEDVAIDYLEQTPIDTLDPNNVLDAEGIKRITESTSSEQELTNERERQREQTINDQNKKAEIEIKDQNIRAEMEQRDLDRQNAEDEARRTREVAQTRAREQAETTVEVQRQRAVAEQETIAADEVIQDRAIEKDRVVQEKQFALDKDLLRLEQEKIESGENAEVERTRRIQLAEQERDAKVIAAAFEVAESKAGLEAKEKEVTNQHQQRLDIEADMSAERARRVLNIEAEARAEASQKEDIIAADAEKNVRAKKAEAQQIEVTISELAQKEAAEHAAERVQITADAESKASEKRNHAMQQEAEGTAAMEAAAGLAEAKVITAKADAEKTEGLAQAAVLAAQGEASGKAKSAEGKGEADAIAARGKAEAEAISATGTAEGSAISAKGTAEGEAVRAVKLAEAEGKTEMAKAIELFNKASQDHEEFRLQLDKDKAVDLAEIQIQKDVAEAQARVVGEALKSANIDIVGGEHDFFEKVVKSVIQGRSVDRLMDNSQTLTDVKNTFFTGDPDHFKGQLRKWIDDLGVSTEDVKNLTVAAALTKLMSAAGDSGTKNLLRQAQKAAKDSGVTDIIVGTLLGDAKK